jgi:hypothetical protein
MMMSSKPSKRQPDAKLPSCQVAKRQCLNLAQDVAQDFENYYQQNQYWKPENTTDLLVITGDGKGMVMLPDSLRECTKKAALKSKKLNSRLSQGEKKDRKRMAQVMSVYTVLPHVRTPESIMKVHDDENDNVRKFRAPARNKRVWASVERDAGTVIEEVFEEALRRDPEQKRRWVVWVDGFPSPLKLIDKISQCLARVRDYNFHFLSISIT